MDDFETHVYRKNETVKSFAASITGTFTDAEQEKKTKKLPFALSNIHNIMWCVNAVGYVELFWQTLNDIEEDFKICVLSGNGRWDLKYLGMEFMVPENSTGELLISTSGFDDLDSYTIVISGNYKEPTK